ncbi:MAG: hypothetical protein KKI06_14000 [Euryarchaeota archaeon]|nr:hypothetical protein [Euryarchaeota archaeon]
MNAEKKDLNICVYLRSSAVEIYEKTRISTDAHRFVNNHLRSSASCPPQCIDTYAPAGAYVDAPSRGATLGAFICGLNPFHSIKLQLDSVFTVICG